MKTLDEIKNAYKVLLMGKPSEEGVTIGTNMIHDDYTMSEAKGAAYFLHGVRWLEKELAKEKE